MQRVEMLKQQAEVLRRMAASFDAPVIKEDLLSLAERCETAAANIARELKERLQRPIDEAASEVE